MCKCRCHHMIPKEYQWGQKNGAVLDLRDLDVEYLENILQYCKKNHRWDRVPHLREVLYSKYLQSISLDDLLDEIPY